MDTVQKILRDAFRYLIAQEKSVRQLLASDERYSFEQQEALRDLANRLNDAADTVLPSSELSRLRSLSEQERRVSAIHKARRGLAKSFRASERHNLVDRANAIRADIVIQKLDPDERTGAAIKRECINRGYAVYIKEMAGHPKSQVLGEDAFKNRINKLLRQ